MLEHLGREQSCPGGGAGDIHDFSEWSDSNNRYWGQRDDQGCRRGGCEGSYWPVAGGSTAPVCCRSLYIQIKPPRRQAKINSEVARLLQSFTYLKQYNIPMAMSRYLPIILLAYIVALLGSPSHLSTARPLYRIYVTNERSGDMSVIDPVRNEVIATVPLGKRPRGIHASPDGNTIYMTLSGTPIAGPTVDPNTLPPPDRGADGIGVFDVGTNKLIRIIPSGSDPEQFDVSKDGHLLFVSNEDAASASIVEVRSGKVTHTLPVGQEPEGVEVSHSGHIVYVTSENDGTISVIDASAAKVIKTFKVGHRPRAVAFLPDDSKAYVTAENDGAVTLVDSVRHQSLQTIPLGEPGVIKPMSVILSGDGTKAFVSTGRGHRVFVIDTTTQRVIKSIEVGERPWGLAVSPDGKTLFTANGPSNDVSVVDLERAVVTNKIKVGNGPWGIVVVSLSK